MLARLVLHCLSAPTPVTPKNEPGSVTVVTAIAPKIPAAGVLGDKAWFRQFGCWCMAYCTGEALEDVRRPQCVKCRRGFSRNVHRTGKYAPMDMGALQHRDDCSPKLLCVQTSSSSHLEPTYASQFE